MIPLYFELKNLPQPPVDLVNGLLDQWTHKHKLMIRVGNYPNVNMEMAFRCTHVAQERISTFDPIDHEIKNWLQTNVFCNTYTNWILRVLHTYSANQELYQGMPLYEKHLDSIDKNKNIESNKFVLIYNLTNSHGDLAFYQEQGMPLIRQDRPIFLGDTATGRPHDRLVFGNCKEVARYRPAPRTWYLARIDVIHSVENTNQIPRVALQLRLTDTDVQKIFALTLRV
jgi:hypothetical protein